MDSVDRYRIVEKDDILLRASSPEIYRINTFRLVELPIDATVQQIRRREQEYATLNKMGLSPEEITDQMGGIIPLTPPPSEDIIHQAFHRLRDPESRLVDELFWFWPLEPGDSIDDDEALFMIKSGDYQSSIAIWSEREREGTESMVSTHNLAILFHMLALDIEHIGMNGTLTKKQHEQKQNYWKDAYIRWKNCIDQEGLWNRLTRRIREFNDPRLTTGVVHRFRTTLPLSLLLINASVAARAAESGNKTEAKEHIQIMVDSGFSSDMVEKALQFVIVPMRERVKLICASLEKEVKKSIKNFNTVASNMIKQIAQPLEVIDILLPKDNVSRQAIHDQAALKVLEITIEYCNKTSNWGATKKLMTSALGFAVSDSARRRIKNNLDIIESSLELGTCWFCKKNPSESKCEIKIKMYGNVTRTPDFYGYGTQTTVRWNYNTFIVPRCSECMKAHSSVNKYVWLGILAGLIIGIISLLGFFQPDSVCFGIIIIVILAVVGGAIGGKIGQNKLRKGVLPESKKTDFPTIKKKLGEGWQFGEKPPNVQ